MIKSEIKAYFPVDIKLVWDTVTSLDNCAWRSDIKAVEVGDDGNSFNEITKNGFATAFKITEYSPYERYAFDMDNDNMSGSWTGRFAESNGGCVIEFTEYVTPKKRYMKALIKLYLRKQQNTYVKDLKKALSVQ